MKVNRDLYTQASYKLYCTPGVLLDKVVLGHRSPIVCQR